MMDMLVATVDTSALLPPCEVTASAIFVAKPSTLFVAAWSVPRCADTTMDAIITSGRTSTVPVPNTDMVLVVAAADWTLIVGPAVGLDAIGEVDATFFGAA